MKEVTELSKEEEQRALDLYRKSIVIDAVNIAWQTPEYLDRFLKSGYTGCILSMSIWGWDEAEDTQAYPAPTFDFRDAMLRVIPQHYRWLALRPDKWTWIDRAEDIESAKKEGKVAISLGSQNTRPIEAGYPGYACVDILYKLGVKMMGLTHNDQNLVAAGCAERTDSGLTNYGVGLIEKMNELGMLVDLAHTGKRSCQEAIEVSKDPVIFSHASPLAVTPNPRNHTDEEIKAMAEKGGVFCPTALSFTSFVKEGVQPSVEDYFTHIDYLVKLVGVDYIGVGSDLDEGRPRDPRTYVTRWATVHIPPFRGYDLIYMKKLSVLEDLPNIARGLVVRGYSDQEIQKILGGNLLRLIKRVMG